MLPNRRILATFIAILASACVAGAKEAPVDIVGEWKATGDLPDGGTNASVVTITKDGDELKGVAVNDDNGNETVIDRIKVEGKKVIFEIDVESGGETGLLRVKAELASDTELKGEWALFDDAGEERFKADWKAVREAPPVDIVGEWDAVAKTGDGQELKSLVTFAKKDDKLTGSSKSERNDTTFDSVKLEDNKLTVEMTLDMNGTELDVEIKAEPKETDHLVGKWIIFDDTGQEAASGDWEAKRKASFELVGDWDVVAKTDDGEMKYETSFAKKDDAHTGSVKSDAGEIDYDSIKIDGETVALKLPFGDGSVKIDAKTDGADKLKGTWTYLDGADSEAATGEWLATRKAKE